VQPGAPAALAMLKYQKMSAVFWGGANKEEENKGATLHFPAFPYFMKRFTIEANGGGEGEQKEAVFHLRRHTSCLNVQHGRHIKREDRAPALRHNYSLLCGVFIH